MSEPRRKRLSRSWGGRADPQLPSFYSGLLKYEYGQQPLHSLEKSTENQAIYIQASYFISIEMNNRED